MCAQHGEPFRDEWPKGALLFMVYGFQKLMEIPATQEVCNDEDKLIFKAKLEAYLDNKPLCCRLDSLVLLGLYAQIHEEIGLWKHAKCQNCGTMQLGSTYQVLAEKRWGKSKVIKYHHICFNCIIHPPKLPGG